MCCPTGIEDGKKNTEVLLKYLLTFFRRDAGTQKEQLRKKKNTERINGMVNKHLSQREHMAECRESLPFRSFCCRFSLPLLLY